MILIVDSSACSELTPENADLLFTKVERGLLCRKRLCIPTFVDLNM